MTLIEMVKMTGELPNKAKTESGQDIELFIRKRTGIKGYIVCLWLMLGDFQESMLYYGEGPTIEEAKEDCKNKILKN